MQPPPHTARQEVQVDLSEAPCSEAGDQGSARTQPSCSSEHKLHLQLRPRISFPQAQAVTSTKRASTSCGRQVGRWPGWNPVLPSVLQAPSRVPKTLCSDLQLLGLLGVLSVPQGNSSDFSPRTQDCEHQTDAEMKDSVWCPRHRLLSSYLASDSL